MLEAKLQNATVLKRVFEAMACLVNEVNLDCDESGLKLQAMDQSHVALVSLKLDDVGFLHYRCDRPRSLGLNMASVVKVFKLCGPMDTVSIQNEDDGDMITFVFENSGFGLSGEGVQTLCGFQNEDEGDMNRARVAIQSEDKGGFISAVFENGAEEKTSTFSLRLMGIEQESLGVPEAESSDCTICMSAKEYSFIVNTLKEINESITIQVDQQAIHFITNGDIGGGEIVLRANNPTPDDDSDVGVSIQVSHLFI
ncbi:proliferating cell nuclear antigen 1, putative [Eimeria brunetti]|uniref:DNA sliding clamp PCNA n=1 Tax=Eimeria brunetti TaxID=51314 RepID=U6LC71_9EIME|nr:proliferating cell nuclear antigen 1, putative [Eimeria brunetti]